MPHLFISYRWDDDAGSVNRIVDHLRNRLPQWEIFFDIDSIPLGQPFPEKYSIAVATSDVVFVMIGPKWLKHLLDRKNLPIDHVRNEVTLALGAGCDVVPITISNTRIPTPLELSPVPSVVKLSSQNGKAIRPGSDFARDIDDLVSYLESKHPEDIGTLLGGKYKLHSMVDEGGMGIVFKARSIVLRRDVAVKLIKPGMDSKEVLARFEVERQALASLQHPNIAYIIDAGQSSGKRPYFVMEYVDGIPITKYCDDHNLTLRERLNLFRQICDAVQHAHDRHILHRDLKPSNVLVEVLDGKPVSKVIDFGLAKALNRRLTEKTLDTRTVMLGTVGYSSPEATLGKHREIRETADVYSLGIILYELVTGLLPFDPPQSDELGDVVFLHRYATSDAPRPVERLASSKELTRIAANRGVQPKSLVRMVKGALERIILHAIEKEPINRYSSAKQLAIDVERFERGDKIVIRTKRCTNDVKAKVNKLAKLTLMYIGLITMCSVTNDGYAFNVVDGAIDNHTQQILRNSNYYDPPLIIGFTDSSFYVNQVNFSIPFEIDDIDLARFKKGQLYISHNGNPKWQLHSEIDKGSKLFKVIVPAEGVYHFFLRTLDTDGKFYPKTLDNLPVDIQKTIVTVDLTPPVIQFYATRVDKQQAILHWEIKDENLYEKLIVLESKLDDLKWETVNAAVAPKGERRIIVPNNRRTQFRITASDYAKNKASKVVDH